jgi:hypothetical protein
VTLTQKLKLDLNTIVTSYQGGKMKLNVYGGFTFEQLSYNQYAEANLTDKLHFPYHKDFGRQKFKSVMKGNTLLAGFEQSDGTILPNDKLKIAAVNILTSAQLHMAKTVLEYVTSAYNNTVMDTLFMTSPSQTSSTWCYPKALINGYPSPIFPLVSADPLRITFNAVQLPDLFGIQ